MPSVINPRSGPFPVYSSTSPPTVDVGIFTIAKTGVDLKTAATYTIFTVPTSRTFVCTGWSVLVTAVTSGGAGSQNVQVKESGAAGIMVFTITSATGTPVANKTFYAGAAASGGSILTACTAGNSVQNVQGASQSGSTAVTGTFYITGFYVQ